MPCAPGLADQADLIDMQLPGSPLANSKSGPEDAGCRCLEMEEHHLLARGQVEAKLPKVGERPADRRVDIDQLQERIAQRRAGATQDLWDGIAKQRLAVGNPHDAAGGVMGVKYHAYLVAAVRERLLRHRPRGSGAQPGAAGGSPIRGREAPL